MRYDYKIIELDNYHDYLYFLKVYRMAVYYGLKMVYTRIYNIFYALLSDKDFMIKLISKLYEFHAFYNRKLRS